MRTLFLIGLLGWSAMSATHAASVREISEASARSLAIELESYLKQNPQAPDRAEGLHRLASAYGETGNLEKAMAALKERYPLLLQGPGTNVETVFNGVVGPYVLLAIAAGKKDEAKEFVTRARQDFAAHPHARSVMPFLAGLDAQLRIPGVGETLKIAFTGANGETVDLARMKGKVVLVDFWATWCGPCIDKLPDVLATYQKHHENGFEIIGISLDPDRATMERFVRARGMDWVQYCDEKAWKGEIPQAHGITAIPASFLVGKDGKIVASNLSGGELEKRVAELLAKP